MGKNDQQEREKNRIFNFNLVHPFKKQITAYLIISALVGVVYFPVVKFYNLAALNNDIFEFIAIMLVTVNGLSLFIVFIDVSPQFDLEHPQERLKKVKTEFFSRLNIILKNLPQKKWENRKILFGAYPREIEFQKDLLNYYNRICLDFTVDSGYFKQPGKGIKISQDIRGDDQKNVYEMVLFARKLLYFSQEFKILLVNLILPLMLVFILPFLFVSEYDMTQPYLIFILLGLIVLFIGIIWKIYQRFSFYKTLKILSCTVLGIYLPTEEDLIQERKEREQFN